MRARISWVKVWAAPQSMVNPLQAAIAQLPASVRVGATSSVGYDHIDVAAAKARGNALRSAA